MKLVLVFLTLCEFIRAMKDTGTLYGYLANCPGMTKNTTLSAETRRTLTVIAIWPSSNWPGSKEQTCHLSQQGAACVAKYLDFKKRKTLLLVSGYLDASFSPIVRSMIQPYLQRGYNVIIMEIFPVLIRSYPIAARITKPLGHILGEFLAELSRRGLSHSELEMLGGSLGAHIAAHACNRYHELTHFKPARFTVEVGVRGMPAKSLYNLLKDLGLSRTAASSMLGRASKAALTGSYEIWLGRERSMSGKALDPAGPCFRNLPPSERVNSNVAHHVDAVHTNMDGFGLADPVGHVDFYVNGGEFQPEIVKDFLLPCLHLCSHLRSAVYWVIANLKSDKFIAVNCPSLQDARHGNCYRSLTHTNLLGPKTNFSRPGIYYLPTTSSFPFYLGQKGLEEREFGNTNYLLSLTPDEDIIV